MKLARRKKLSAAGARISAVLYCPAGTVLMPKAIQSLVRQSLPPDEYDIILVAESESVLVHHTEAELSAILNLHWHRQKIADHWAARRLSLELSKTPLLAFMDAAAAADRDWLAAYRRTFEAYGDDIALIGGRVRPLWAVPRPSWLGDDLLPELSLVDLGDEIRFLQPGETIGTVNFAVQAASIAAMDGFAADHSALRIINDETALVQRVRAGGAKLLYDPAAAVDYPVLAEHTKQSWFRRRAAWRAVSDALKAPSPDMLTPEERWQRVKDFIFEAPPTDRTVRALVLEQRDPVRFQGQVAAIEHLLRCLLDGIGEPDDD